MNAFGCPKFFLAVVGASNSHHVSCAHSIRRKYVPLASTFIIAIFGQCENFTWEHAFSVKSLIGTLRHHKTTLYRSEALFHLSQVPWFASECFSWFLGSNIELPPAKIGIREKIVNFSINYGSGSCNQYRTRWAIIID